MAKLKYNSSVSILFVLLLFLFLQSGCAVKSPMAEQGALDVQSRQKIAELESLLLSLDRRVDAKEAKLLARESIIYAYSLSQRYELVRPPWLHNTLVNAGLKDRGLCYQWADDMLAHLQKTEYGSFDLVMGVASQGKLSEHSALVVSARGEGFDNGVVLDPWRNSGDLFFMKIREDKRYDWGLWDASLNEASNTSESDGVVYE